MTPRSVRCVMTTHTKSIWARVWVRSSRNRENASAAAQEWVENAQPTSGPGNDHGGDVVALGAVKARNRLDGLLSTRSHLATMATQQRSHNMDEAHKSFLTQCSIESTIRQEYPEAFEQSYAG